MTRTWRGTALALGTLVLCASACGIPIDASAKPVASAQAGLLAGNEQIPGSVYKPGSTPVSVYFIRDGQLYPVERYINSSTLSISAEAAAALSALNVGPTSKEESESVTSSLNGVPPAHLRIDSIDSQGHVALVELDQQFIPPALFGSTLALAFAQIVYTLTSSIFSKQIQAVEFELNGEAWPAYLPNGSLQDGAVKQRDYSIFLGAAAKTPPPRRVVENRAPTKP